MGQFPLIDIVISLSLIYTFLSLLSSELTQILTTVLRWRAKHLQQGIMTLLGESVALRRNPEQFKNTIMGKLYHSSLIASLTQRSNRGRRTIAPTYIRSEVFADALLEVLQNLPESKTTETQLQQDTNQSVHTLAALVAKVERSPDLSPQLKDNLRRIAQRVQASTEDTHQQIEQFRHKIAVWFKQSTDRISGIYQRHVKVFNILISTILAVLINADSLYMIRRISENTATRAIVVQNITKIQGCEKNLNSQRCVEQMAGLMESTTFPIAWHRVNRQKQFSRISRSTVLRAIGGWLLTAISISMGSRFWFGILNRLMRFRGDLTQPRPDTRYRKVRSAYHDK